MIVLCTGKDCGHEWQCVVNDQVCDWCGAPGKSIGSDYMSECDQELTNYDTDHDEPTLLDFLGSVETTGLRTKRG